MSGGGPWTTNAGPAPEPGDDSLPPGKELRTVNTNAGPQSVFGEGGKALTEDTALTNVEVSTIIIQKHNQVY